MAWTPLFLPGNSYSTHCTQDDLTSRSLTVKDQELQETWGYGSERKLGHESYIFNKEYKKW